jgi:hypothetical protein
MVPEAKACGAKWLASKTGADMEREWGTPGVVTALQSDIIVNLRIAVMSGARLRQHES